MTKILVLGKSHVWSLHSAFLEGLCPDVLEPVFLYYSQYAQIYTAWDLQSPLTDQFKADLVAHLAGVRAVAIIAQGNIHSMMSLVLANPPIDYISTLRGDEDTRADAYLVPEDLILDVFDTDLFDLKVLVHNLRLLGMNDIVVLGPPTPFEDNDTIMERLDPYVREHADPNVPIVIGPPSYRRKFWETYESVYRNLCQNWGLPFLNVPASAMTASGFLSPEAFGTDATHGNNWYGAHRLRQIAMFLGLVSPEKRK